MSASDAVMPAERVLVDETPKIAESGRKRGEKRGQHTPAAQTTMHGRAIKLRERQASGAEPGSRTCVDDKHKLVSHPEQHSDGGGDASEQPLNSSVTGLR